MKFKKNMALRVNSGALKSRLLKKFISNYGYWLGGFFTQELRSGGVREGFILKTPRGGWELLASKKIISKTVFNKYGVNLPALDVLGVQSLVQARKEGKIVLLDELGPLILQSEKLAVQALDALGSGETPCLATFRKGAKTFEEAFLKMDNTIVLDLNGKTFTEVEAVLEGWLEFWIDRLKAEGC
ncbi:MAG: hypothetical protein HY796_05380 [Elusimicrobia bacterium]|nr:hypothetical protein [Elusimicrobiota bacterium]